MSDRNEILVVDDKFVLSKELGRGATGTVWEATDLVTGEVVAIKILHPHLFASSLARKRFYREMKSASSLRHQNTVIGSGVGPVRKINLGAVRGRFVEKTLHIEVGIHTV